MRKNVIITDRMQRGYVYWRTEPVGRNFAPGFTPDLTPKEMLRLGIFGGKYMTDCQEEFPRSWFARARLCAERHDARLNRSEEHTSELQSQSNLVCRLLLE